MVLFHCDYRNPVAKIQLCFSSVPVLNTVACTNMVLIHNKANNRVREEKCSPESHKYGISSGGKLLSTRMRQKWTRVNLDVPGAAASWRDVTKKGSGSPTAYFVCAGDFLFPPLLHFWTALIPSGVRTTLPLSLLLWAPSQEALHYCRSTRAFWAQLEMNTAERRTKNDRAFLADVGYKKRPRCGETSLTKGVCQEHGETGLQCGNDTARFRKRKLKLSKHAATWGCWEKWKSLHFVWFPSSTGRGLPGKGPSPSLAGCRAEERPVAPAPGKLGCGSPRSTQQDRAARLPLWPALILSALPGASAAQGSLITMGLPTTNLDTFAVHSLFSELNVGMGRGALQGGWWMVVSLTTFYF